MPTFREAIYEILNEDATSGELASLLGYDASSKPQCVFYTNPPERVAPPILTYSIISASGDFPRRITWPVTVWGGDHDAIFDRVYQLLHERRGTESDTWLIKAILLDNEGPDIWDEDLKVYYKQIRYEILLARIT